MKDKPSAGAMKAAEQLADRFADKTKFARIIDQHTQAPALAEALRKMFPLIEQAHKSAVNKAVYQPLEAAMNKAREAIRKYEETKK